MKFKNLNNFITKIPANYLAEIANKNVAFVGNCKDIYTYFKKINKNCKYFSITKQNWKSVVKSLTQKDKNNMPKFDVIVGNPPYEGKGNPLYLQILEKVNVDNKKVIWICPTQWVKNYKDTDFINRIKTKSCSNMISYEFVGNPFDNAAVGNDVGIFYFGENKVYVNYEDLRWNKFKNVDLAKSICNKLKNFADNLENHEYNKNDKILAGNWVNASWIRGHFQNGVYLWDWTTIFGEENKHNFKFKCGELWHHWKFNTINECKNFVNYADSDIVMFSIYITKINTSTTGFTLSMIPWMGDYTHEWTEKEIAKKLKLTKEEVEYIHQEMANFGWKAKGKK